MSNCWQSAGRRRSYRYAVGRAVQTVTAHCRWLHNGCFQTPTSDCWVWLRELWGCRHGRCQAVAAASGRRAIFGCRRRWLPSTCAYQHQIILGRPCRYMVQFGSACVNAIGRDDEVCVFGILNELVVGVERLEVSGSDGIRRWSQTGALYNTGWYRHRGRHTTIVHSTVWVPIKERHQPVVHG